jgi:DNA-binding GntR family transcriptional regulator
LTFLYEIIYDLNMKGTISKQRMAYELIRERILDGTYPPGTRIVLDAVAREIGTSTIPVREAIRRLEADGLIEYQPFAGARVAPMDETAYVQSLSVLAVLEGYATALSASRLTEEDFRRLEEINQSMKEALTEFDFVRFGNLNRDFHQTILERCGNDVLKEQIRQIGEKLDAVRQRGVWHVPSRARESIDEHEHLVELLRRKAPAEEIEKAARQHKLNTVTAFLNRRERSV